MELCHECGAELGNEYVYTPNPLSAGYNDYYLHHCQACSVRLWYCPVHFVFRPGIPTSVRERLQSPKMLRWCNRWFKHARPIPVYVVHRREAESVGFMISFPSTHQHTNRPPEPYSYRGWCGTQEIVLLYDETETLDSIEWVCLHELAHHACNQAAMFDDAMSQENKNDKRMHYEWKDDAGHEADSEERLVNRIATAFMLGREYARPWWRPRVIAHLAGLPMPDPHASLTDGEVDEKTD